jgi:hypothetical protein
LRLPENARTMLDSRMPIVGRLAAGLTSVVPFDGASIPYAGIRRSAA